ncbi:hypothetical protein BCLUESOX_590 [bacterium endosymbiont of Bathymodiolus sp. 5 South]|nr:hypothetical protein [uncultured Gammaproteobacteria bacterium]SHN93408.1 hypothetical protein BCLUESOX_590 [bacterium endosymbiont of Bathymodiolus sp. 5 South]
MCWWLIIIQGVKFLDFIKDLDKIVFKCYSKFFNHYFLKMKNTTNT